MLTVISPIPSKLWNRKNYFKNSQIKVKKSFFIPLIFNLSTEGVKMAQRIFRNTPCC